MKTIITTAMLAAAGAVFSNAETVNLAFSQTDWSGNGSITATFPTLSETQKLDSWTLSFDFDYTADTHSNQWGSTILSTGSDAFANDYSGGFQIRWANGTESAAANSDGRIFVKYAGNDTSVLTLASSEAFDSDKTLSFSLSYDYMTKTLSASLNGGAAVSATVSRDVSFSQLTTSGSGYGAADSWRYSNLSGTAVVSTIPEPSAFGLLAGAGALALVAARRRRAK